ncbi:unnamed protein product [Rotaria socialis]|uniref:T-box domain-containing protein n=1 Tax=Rotaria socialis TaxID=392032 RepID=A0A818D7H6_9BILA|nr:unnamed protein product [Rotaria socialis]CAF3404452.1 unnamed protein product [Rotaria socialis]CAF3436923.1 unnamed protein product [Rotaria socialis]CAF4164830.1 unnamed protein product [Rotaria socialis]CAF4346163.1 unnamed protein product [Rotaria socialis]
MQYSGLYEQIQYYNQENISINLHNRDLWNQFHEITNEMIVTKAGRRMFPIVSINIGGLDPDKMYTVELSFDQLDSHRWRYASCKWQPGMKADETIHRSPYQHPDSPNYGRTWMKDIVAFPKVKLTNKIDQIGTSQVLLNSLHKYRPRISIIDIMSKTKIYEISFDETEFIAVTAYQNEEVKALKIRHNPFAKAFLDVETFKRETDDEQAGRTSIFGSQESSSGGPDRVKLQSYRCSPYSYTHSQRRSSLNNGLGYPSSSTSLFDLSPFYAPITSSNIPCSSSSSPPLPDSTAHSTNLYYPSSPPYYFSYGAPSPSSSSIPHYPFMYPFNYPLNNNSNQEPTSYLQMQPPMAMSSTDNNYMNPLIPITQDVEQY